MLIIIKQIISNLLYVTLFYGKIYCYYYIIINSNSNNIIISSNKIVNITASKFCLQLIMMMLNYYC